VVSGNRIMGWTVLRLPVVAPGARVQNVAEEVLETSSQVLIHVG
jgi:hypothetical protein